LRHQTAQRSRVQTDEEDDEAPMIVVCRRGRAEDRWSAADPTCGQQRTEQKARGPTPSAVLRPRSAAGPMNPT
jgi:hypothetical protein